MPLWILESQSYITVRGSSLNYTSLLDGGGGGIEYFLRFLQRESGSVTGNIF